MEFLKIWEILLRRKWIIINAFLVILATVVLVTHLLTPVYEARAKLLVEKSDTLSSLLSNLGLQTMGVGLIATGDEDYETDIALATIRPLLEELISSLDLRDRQGELMESDDLVGSSLRSKISAQPYLEIDQYEDADMLEIVSNSADPFEAANISNKLAELYINNRLERTRKEYKAARIFIEDQIQKVKEEYYKSLVALQDFKIKQETVDLNLETQNLINKTASLRTSYEANEERIVELEEELAEARKELKEREKFRKESKEFAQSDQVKSLKTKLNDLLISISGKSIDFHKEHPEYKQLEKEIEKAKELVKDEANVVFNRERFSVDPIHDELSGKLVEDYIEREVSIAKRKLLEKYINEYQDELLKIPAKSIESSKLELATSVNKEMYQNLLEYLTQVGIAESMTVSNIRTVEAATVPDKPSFPTKVLNYILGAVLGLFWGLALGFFIEYIDNTIKSPEDIRHIRDLTLLGTIPRSKVLKKLGLVTKANPTMRVTEAFRTIRNSILYASVDRPIKTLVITSSMNGEGKSSMAANLSLTFNMEDKRVLLVDLDLRRPSVHKFFNISNKRGMTNVLAEGLELKEAIVDSGIKGVHLLPSGPIPPDPSRLVESQRLKDIIHVLKETFDMVIMDMPPAMAVNDPIVIGKTADATLLIVESGKTTFSMVNDVRGNMGEAGLNIIGVVLNKFKAPRTGYYHYYYRYDRYYAK